MERKNTIRRVLVLIFALALFAVIPAGMAGATKAPADGADPADGHKITICHATRSLSNPYVEFTIDVAAWNNPDDPKHHGDHHTRTKDGITWSDYILGEGEECSLDLPPDPDPVWCAGVEVDIVVDFGDVTLLSSNATNVRLTATALGLSIPAGTYDVILGSSDDPHDPRQVQNNEQWRALFVGSVYSGYASDLPQTWLGGVVMDTHVGAVTLGGTVDTIVAEHWDANAANTSTSPDSVEPVCVDLVEHW